MSSSNFRVVLHINEDDPVDQNETSRGDQLVSASPTKNSLQPLKENSALDKMKAEILLVNDNSLQLNLKSTENKGSSTTISHKMRFDHVSDSAVEMIKREFALITDELLVKRQNACVMRFGIKQEMDIELFFGLLITFLNTGTYFQKYKLQYVKLKCSEMAVSLSLPTIPHTETGLARIANLVFQGDNSDDDCNNNSVTYRLPRDAKNECFSTRDLLTWLLNEYRLNFASSKGHEKLQFSFFIVDNYQKMFKVKFSLYNIFLNLMNSEYRNLMGVGCQGVDRNFIPSGLAINLPNYIENAVLIFYVPNNIKKTAEAIELLQIASSVIKNRRRKLVSTRKIDYHNLAFLNTSDDCNNYLFLNQSEESKNDLPLNNKMHNNKCIERKLVTTRKIDYHNLAFLHTSDDCNNYLFLERNEESKNDLPPNNKMRRSLPSSLMSYNPNKTLLGSFCGNECHGVNSWYRKIDECFEKTSQLRNEYFNCFFKYKIKDMSLNIKSICKTLESFYTNQSEKNLLELEKYYIELQESFERYRSAEMLFRQLNEYIKSSNCEQAVKVYLETKTSEFNIDALILKQENLEWCQRHLNFTFEFVLTGLNLSL